MSDEQQKTEQGASASGSNDQTIDGLDARVKESQLHETLDSAPTDGRQESSRGSSPDDTLAGAELSPTLDPTLPDELGVDATIDSSSLERDAKATSTVDGVTEGVGASREDTAVPGTAMTLAPESDGNSGDFATGEFSVDEATVDGTRIQKSSSSTPSKVGNYKIEGVLGRGGMGVVYRARHQQLGRDVALKMVLAGAHASKEQLERFIQEARAVAHLQHPNIVQIFEVSEQQGLPYFSLEFVDGMPLDKRLKDGMLTDREAAEMMQTICVAMQYAHDNKILHRDIKPANILLTTDGAPKVTDFGLAKKLEDADESSSTRTGTVMGTPSYMSPEQAKGLIHELGPATDQYSLGAMLYEFLTGRPPFIGAKPIETIMKVVRDEPVTPRQINEACPIDLETICLKALQKDSEKRYASCSDMAEDLQRFLDGKPILARPVSRVEAFWRWCKRNPTVASLTATAATLLIAVAGISVYSANSLATKNSLLSEANENLEQSKKDVLKANSDLAATNDALKETNDALTASNEEGVRRSKRLQSYVQNVFRSVGSLNVTESPRAKPFRDDLLQKTLPLIDEIIQELPEDAQATPTKMAGLYQLARSYRGQEMGKEAETILLKLIELAEGRVVLKQGSDAARNNLSIFLTDLSQVRLSLNRDFQASLDAAKRATEIARSMVQDSKASADGKGMMAPVDSKALLCARLRNLAVNYYRMGNSKEATPLFEESFKLRKEVIQSLEDGTGYEGLPENIKVPDARTINNKLAILKRELASGSLARAAAHFRVGNLEEAYPLYKQAYDKSEADLEGDSSNPLFLRQAIGIGGMWGEFLAQTGKVKDAIPVFMTAASRTEPLLKADPKNSDFRRTTSIAFYRLSQWVADETKAAEWGDKALEMRLTLSEAAPEDSKLKIELLPSLARRGDLVRASTLAEEFSNAEKVDSEILIEVAKAYSLCAGRAENANERAHFLNQSKEALENAIDLGLRDLQFFKRDADLKTLSNEFELSELL